MKTTTQNTKTGLKSRPEHSSTGAKPQINYSERDTNRSLPTNYILSSLERWMPHQHKLAIVAGGLISIQFEKAPIQRVRQELSEMGFSWSEKRSAWMHFGVKGGARL